MILLELKLSKPTYFLYLNGKFLKAVHFVFSILHTTLKKEDDQQIVLTECLEEDTELQAQSPSLSKWS